MIHSLMQFCERMSGMTMKEQQRLSYQMREAGENVPYLASLDSNTLVASPTKKQKALSQFFDEKAEGHRVLKKYSLTSVDGTMMFTMRTKDQVVNLI